MIDDPDYQVGQCARCDRAYAQLKKFNDLAVEEGDEFDPLLCPTCNHEDYLEEMEHAEQYRSGA